MNDCILVASAAAFFQTLLGVLFFRVIFGNNLFLSYDSSLLDEGNLKSIFISLLTFPANMIFELIGAIFGAAVGKLFLMTNEKIVVKSSLSAALIFATTYFLFDLFKFFMRLYYTEYDNDLFLASMTLIVPPFLLGLLSAYFLMRNKGEPFLRNFHDLGLFAVFFSFLLLALPEVFLSNYMTYTWGLPQSINPFYYGDNFRPFHLGEVIVPAFFLYLIKTSISIIPCFFGVLIGALVFLRPLKMEVLTKRILSGYMLVTVPLLMFLSFIIWTILH